MMILVGQFDSPFVRRVAATMNHYGLPFDRHVLSVFGDREEVLRLNPLGRVPALILEQGETLIESAAIVDYLDELAPPEKRLTAERGEARRQSNRLAALFMGISERAVQYRLETVRRPRELQHVPFADGYLSAIRESLDFLDRDIAAPWALGKTLSQADFAATAALTHLCSRIDTFADLSAWPRLAELRLAGEALPAFKDAPFEEG